MMRTVVAAVGVIAAVPLASSTASYAQTVTFADARVMDIRQRDLSTKNGQVGSLSESESLGLGIRVMANGSWGFASTDQLNVTSKSPMPSSTITSAPMKFITFYPDRVEWPSTTKRSN